MRDELLLRPRWLREWPGHFSLIEFGLGSSSGVPDAHLVAKGFPPGWVEFKAVNGEGLFKLRPQQRLWTREFLPYCSRVACVVLSDLGWWTFPGREVALGQARFLDPWQLSSPVAFTKWEAISPALLLSQLERVYA